MEKEELEAVSSVGETTPDFGEGVSIPYLLGIAKCKGKVKILLDIDKVLTTNELTGLDKLIS